MESFLGISVYRYLILRLLINITLHNHFVSIITHQKHEFLGQWKHRGSGNGGKGKVRVEQIHIGPGVGRIQKTTGIQAIVARWKIDRSRFPVYIANLFILWIHCKGEQAVTGSFQVCGLWAWGECGCQCGKEYTNRRADVDGLSSELHQRSAAGTCRKPWGSTVQGLLSPRNPSPSGLGGCQSWLPSIL